jgi:UDP-N-acetylmuramyl-tripeptide synthetase
VSLANPSADVYVKVFSETPTGLQFQIHSPYGTAQIDSALHGRFNAFNVAVAVIAVTGLGFAFTQVANAAAHLLPVDGRMQEVKGGGDLRVVVDYAHTPDALASALGALKPSCAGMLWVVFGCGGDRDAGKRSEMGKIATSLADQLIVTNDNPRSEAPGAIANDILRGVGTSSCRVELDRTEAIRYAVLNAQPGDTVLVAGKGHETYQLVGDKQLDFSDVDCAAQVLREREVAYA